MARQVKIELKKAKIVFKKNVVFSYYGRTTHTVKFVVNDPVYQKVYFQTSAKELLNVNKNDLISCVLTVSGVSTPSEKYPEICIFGRRPTKIGIHVE
jgi:hypothetical protein